MLPWGVRPSLLATSRVLCVVVPGLAAADFLGTLFVLPLAGASAPLATVLVLDTLRYWALAGLVVWPVTAGLVLLLSRTKWLTASRLLAGVLSAAVAIAVTRTLLSLPNRAHFEFMGLLHVYDWCVLGLSCALSAALWSLLARARHHLAEHAARLELIMSALAALGGGAVALSVAHLVAAPVYEHRVAAPLGVLGLCWMATLLATWGPVPRRLPPLLPAALLVGLLASWPFVVHAGARFVLHGHVPIAGSYAVYFRNWTDFDGDGSTSTLHGGSDCAPFDATIAPLRLEVPGDGIDQDCRGGDAAVAERQLAPPLAPECEVTKPQHIVLLTIDALRADRIRVDRMPFSTAWARRSVWYQRAYPPAASTAGTLLGIFTGTPLSDLNPETLAGDHIVVGQTFVEVLGRAGYATALYNPYDLHPALWHGIESISLPLDPGSPLTKQRRIIRAQLSGILTWLASSAAAGRPAFVAAHVPDLHAPHLLDGPGEFEHPYDDLARSVDEALGEFVSVLRSGPLGKETVVLVTADHGEQLGQRGRVGHGTLFFEEGVRVPLLVSAPGCGPSVHPEPVSLLGLGALIRRFAHLDASTASHPASPMQRTEPVVVEEASLSALGLKRAVVGRRFKLIDDPQNGGRVAFDLDTDPDETKDLLDAPPPGVVELIGAYQTWLDTRRPLSSH